MARICVITGKKPQYGNNVSHANNRTRRRWTPNLQTMSMPSEALGRMVKLRCTAAGLRTIEHKGGIDAYLLNSKANRLSPETKALKKQVLAAQARQEAKAA